MHDKSWDLANKYTDENMPVFAFPTSDMEKCLPGLLEPWMSTALEHISAGGLRRGSEPLLFLLSLPTMGVVPSMKLSWAVNYLTQQLSANPLTSMAIIIHQNRTTGLRERPKRAPPGSRLGCVSV
jgi:hypothetical protein